MKITKEFINSLTYPDFVGFINQWNVLPGSYTTLSKWINYSRINQNSRILQVACTTGFQSREIANITSCSGEAFDLSEYAVESANYNKRYYTPDIRIEYKVCDGYKYETDKKFSHILVGGGLQFFPDPQKMKDKCISFLDEEGYILASPYYITKELPPNLTDEAFEVFGIRVTTEPYKQVMKLYEDLEIIYEDRNKIICETDEEIEKYCSATTKRACEILKADGIEEVYNAIYERLNKIKVMSNNLRPYQEYSILVLRLRRRIYPNRYTEVF